MGKRVEWTTEQIGDYITAMGGNLTEAARTMSDDFPGNSRVTRQNLQTWVNTEKDEPAQDYMDNFEISRKLRLQQNNNSALRRDLRNLTDAAISKSEVLTSISQVISSMEFNNKATFIPKVTGGKKITIELLFSDLQLGKLMDGYDSQIALRRVDEWVEVAMNRIFSYQHQGYEIEKIILAVLGDVIESDKKHANSGRGCDIGTAQQIEMSIDILFNRVIKQLAKFNTELDVIMITGNHDHDGHGLNMFMPGREHLSWPLYHSVRMLTEAYGTRANFFIPEGSHHVHDIYGAKVLYEHGVGVATSAAAMRKHVANRINQVKEYIHLFRMGDKHNVCRFNNDQLVVNGAFFGDDRIGSDYSGISGYDGYPAQVMFAYVERADDRRTPIFDSLVIQLGHVK